MFIDKMSQTSRLLIASALAAMIISGWKFLYADQFDHIPQRQAVPIEAQESVGEVLMARDAALTSYAKRIEVANNKLSGSINLMGGRIDDLTLKQYRNNVSKSSGNVALLSPAKSDKAYVIEFGWIDAANTGVILPDSASLWHANGDNIAPGSSVDLSYKNPQGVVFNATISLDHHYMFSIKQSIENRSEMKLELANYASISRLKPNDIEDNMIIHQGGIGVFDTKLKEVSYDDMRDSAKMLIDTPRWIGFSDKYWLTAIVPTSSEDALAKFSYAKINGVERYQSSINSKHAKIIAPKMTAAWDEIHIFSGAKELDVLDMYEKEMNIPLFDRAVDFGVLYFITKPIFELLHQMYDLVGNFGVAILLLTVLIKLLLFPLAQKGFKGMNKLKELQPKMMALKDKYSDKPQEFQRSLIDLYKKEKVNPMGGCLPIILQIPVFFALYKVLYVTIEMRHAPFIWWIYDLSAPEGISIFNLFGLLPFSPPSFLMIGIFPILMSITMLIQQNLSPQPTDQMQAQMMKLLPLIFLFMFASFPSGLVIYWTWSNILSIMQQIFLKRIEKK